jgi:hypothetical protein
MQGDHTTFEKHKTTPLENTDSPLRSREQFKPLLYDNYEQHELFLLSLLDTKAGQSISTQQGLAKWIKIILRKYLARNIQPGFDASEIIETFNIYGEKRHIQRDKDGEHPPPGNESKGNSTNDPHKKKQEKRHIPIPQKVPCIMSM